MTPTSRAHGFTLIELVCVIVILGILSATAMPKFANLAKEARIAKLNGMAAALHSSAQLWNAVCLLNSDTTCLTGDVVISRNGLSVAMIHGYPNAGDSIGVNQIDITVNTGGFAMARPSIYYTRFAIADASDPAKCAVFYCENNNASNPDYCYRNSYRVTVATDGC